MRAMPGTMNAHATAAASAALFLSASLFTHTVALRLLFLFAGTGLALYAIARDRPDIDVLPPIWIPFVLWGAWAAASILWSLEPERSLKEFRHEIGFTGLALWTCYVAAQYRNAARIFLPVLAVAVVALCLFALYWFIPDIRHLGRRWHGGPGDHSSALLTILPCLLMTGWFGIRAGWSIPRLFAVAAILLAVFVAAYTTLNRTVWLGFGLEVLVMLALLVWLRPGATAAVGGKMKLAAAIVALAVAGGAIAATLAVHAERELSKTAVSIEQDPRLELWPEIIERIEERPLLGYGFGRGGLRIELREELADGLLWHAHNLFLDALLQAGIPGLVLLLLLLAATAREAWRLTRSGSDAATACGIALAAVLAGMLVRNMTDVLWVRQNALVYWGVVGTLLGLAARATRSRAE